MNQAFNFPPTLYTFKVIAGPDIAVPQSFLDAEYQKSLANISNIESNIQNKVDS